MSTEFSMQKLYFTEDKQRKQETIADRMSIYLAEVLITQILNGIWYTYISTLFQKKELPKLSCVYRSAIKHLDTFAFDTQAMSFLYLESLECTGLQVLDRQSYPKRLFDDWEFYWL